MTNFEHEDTNYNNGMLRGYDLIFENTTSPTISPAQPNYNNYYDTDDRNFLGVYMILPFCFSIATGIFSGYIQYVNKEGYNSLLFQASSKSMLLLGTVTAAITSLYSGGDNVSAENHLSVIAWILTSTPAAFYSAEKVVSYVLANKAHEL